MVRNTVSYIAMAIGELWEQGVIAFGIVVATALFVEPLTDVAAKMLLHLFA